MAERRKAGVDDSARAGYLTATRAAANDGSGLVVVPLRDLIAAIREAVGEARGEGSAAAPRLLNRAQLAESLGCSQSLISKMKQEGMPCLYVGDSPRFVLQDCLRWVAERNPPPCA